jgi:Flp pilus assembly pilin Flp
MSDFITTAQDTGREIAVRTRVALHDLAERAKDQQGQTAAEYMGILLIVSLIIAALITAGVAGDIAGKVDELIGKIGGAQ